MNDWKDCTSYSQGVKREDRKPNVWELRIGFIRAVICAPWRAGDKVWTFAVYGPVALRGRLESTTLDDAKAEVVVQVARRTAELVAAFEVVK